MRPPIVTIRTGLALILSAVTLAVGGAVLIATYVGAQRAVRQLSSRIVSDAARRAELELQTYLEPIEQQLGLTVAWARSGMLRADDPEAMRQLLGPLLEQSSQVNGVVVGDRQGNELRLIRDDSSWGLRQRSAERPSEQVWIRWRQPGASPAEETSMPGASLGLEEREVVPIAGPDSQSREWFDRSLAELGADDPISPVYASLPYRLVGSARLGVTLAMAVRGPGGQPTVVALDILLEGMRNFVRGMTVGEDGSLLILSPEGRIIALQENVVPEGSSEFDWLFRLPAEVDVPVLQAAAAAYAEGAATAGAQRRFRSGDLAWWGQIRPFDLPTGPLLIAVLVPESDLLADRAEIRRRVLAVTAVALLMALGAAVGISRRFSQPIETLVRNAERIRFGDLDAAEPVESSLREVRNLAEAGQRMRSGLATLMKLEGDLQLARQIQRSTLPSRVPRLSGWEIAAHSEPADETGGDTYDLIGLDRGGHLVAGDGACARVALLLADATGHGVGPALSVAQLRGMLRGAMRSEVPLGSIAEHLNEQLVADLPQNRFITAWLGLLDARSKRLRYVSAGQGPLLLLRKTGETEVLNASAPPFGMFPGLTFEGATPLDLEPGDLFVALTDGYFEALAPDGSEFGTEGVVAALRAHFDEPIEHLLEALDAAVEDHTEGAALEDDRTALLLRCAG